MGRIILARHGESEDNKAMVMSGVRDSRLTWKGIDQAHNLVKKVTDRHLFIHHILCSRLRRARKTAEICGDGLQVPVTVLDCLIERHHGILEGRPYSDVPILATKWREAHGFKYIEEVEGGENYEALCERATRVLSEIRQTIERLQIRGDVLVIGHGALSRALITVHEGKTWEDIFECRYLENCELRILE